MLGMPSDNDAKLTLKNVDIKRYEFWEYYLELNP